MHTPARRSIAISSRAISCSNNAPPRTGSRDLRCSHVTDFRLAKLVEAQGDRTRTGVVIGTPRYMAPEPAQAQHGAVGPATDVYSIGLILQELLVGRIPDGRAAHMHTPPPASPHAHPQEGSKEVSPADTLAFSLSTAPAQPTPRARNAIVSRCLEQEPGRRYANAALLADDLHRFLDGKHVHAISMLFRRTCRAMIAHRRAPVTSIAVVASLIVAAFFRERSSPSHEAIAPAVADIQIYDLERDWSNTSNPNGVWTYLAAREHR